MASIDDVARMALALPEVTEGLRTQGQRTWAVVGKTFAWERRFSKADIRRFGDEPVPPHPILAVAVEDLGEKDAVLAEHPRSFFTIPHFDGFAAVLVRLDVVTDDELGEALEDGWYAKAPPELADRYRGQLG
jgi:hypothetical protein